jgi:hypothetical protein
MGVRRITGNERTIGRYAPCRRLTARQPGTRSVGRDLIAVVPRPGRDEDDEVCYVSVQHGTRNSWARARRRPSCGARLSDAEIAAGFRLGEATVKSHVAHVLAELGVRDRAQTAVFCYENGIVRPGRPGAPGPRIARAVNARLRYCGQAVVNHR